MLRTSHGAASLLPVVLDARAAANGGDQGVTAALREEEEEALLVARANEAYLWLLALAAAAECVTTCFLPALAFPRWQLNASATALNLLGPFLDGITYGHAELPKHGEPSVACLQFRSAFLGVFTSFSFMADHAGDLSARSILGGVLYVCASVVGGCSCFLVGKSVVRPVLTSPAVAELLRTASRVKKPSLLSAVAAFIVLSTLRAVFGPQGFVRDPKDPQFVGPLPVADGEELLLGIFMSCSAILLSDYVNGALQSVGRAWHSTQRYRIDWGCLACNAAACALVWLAYGAIQLSSRALTNNLLILKFVSSFCGSLSCFSAAVSHISRLYDAQEYRAAGYNCALHVLVALAFIPLLLKQEQEELPTRP